MPSKKTGTTTTTLVYANIRARQLGQLACPKCRIKLDVLQPNRHRPYQFLGVCMDCGAWHRIELQPGESRGVMVDLPEVASLLPTWDDMVAVPTM